MQELPPPTVYGPVILWERPVQIAASDFLGPSDVALDVGGNTGGVAIALSRMVGDSGRVYTFECNPRMIKWIRQDLAANNIGNVEIVERAVFRKSGEKLKFYIDESYYSASSSLYRDFVGAQIEVESISIDDVVGSRKCKPRVIKIDVEGGEADALAGAEKTIADYRPIFILEYAPGAADYLDLLWSLGYQIWDVNTYDRVDASYRSQHYSSNVVAVPTERGEYLRCAAGSRTVYKSELEFSGDGEGQLTGWSRDGKRTLHTMAQARFGHLAHHSCSALVSPSSEPLDIELRQLSGDGGILIKGLETYEVDFVPK